ncbi:hypothetical protein NE664_10795 [Anaerotignum faecicola]|nr:hypothetical protein [Anaerotignum faecicola]
MKKLLAGILTGAAVLSSFTGVAFAADKETDMANIAAETTEAAVITIATKDGVIDADKISFINLIPLENGDYEVQFELKEDGAAEGGSVKAMAKIVDINELEGGSAEYSKMQVIEKAE